MPLWGLDDTLADKPKIHGRSLLATVQAPGVVDPRTGIYATTAGWVQDNAGRTGKSAMPEVLVAIRGLTTRTGAAGSQDAGFGAAAHVEADLTSINFNISSWSRAAGGIFSVSANFNEQVTVAGLPTLVVQNDTNSRDVTLQYLAADSTTNRVTFTKTIGAAAGDIHAGDVLTIAVNAIAMVGGSTIKDTGSTNNAVWANTATIGTNAGSITAVA